MWCEAKRAVEQLRGALIVTTLMQHHTEVMQCIDVIGVFRKNRPITAFRVGHMACLMEI